MTLFEELVDKANSSTSKEEIKSLLIEINKILLNSKIIINNNEIEPVWVEAYYLKVNNGNSIDFKGCHTQERQSNNYLKIYRHQRGRGGIDLVLSKSDGVYYSVLLKASKIHDTIYKQIGLKHEFDKFSLEDLQNIECNISRNNIKFDLGICKRINVIDDEGYELAAYKTGIGYVSSREDSSPLTKYRSIR